MYVYIYIYIYVYYAYLYVYLFTYISTYMYIFLKQTSLHVSYDVYMHVFYLFIAYMRVFFCCLCVV
jgi:hypothetical protein